MIFDGLVRDFRDRIKLVPVKQSGSKNRKRIVVVTDRIYPYFKGGAEKRYWEVFTNLVRLGYEVTFLTGQWPGMVRRTTVDGIKLVGVYKVGEFYSHGKKSIPETIKYTISVLRYLFSEEYDLIECEQFPIIPIFSSKVASLLLRKPLIVTWHEVWGKNLWTHYLGLRGLLGALLESISVHLPDRVISVSCHTTEKLVRLYHLAPDHIETIPNGMELGWDRRGRATSMPSGNQKGPESSQFKERRVPIEHSDVIYVGRLLEHKNVDVLLRAISHVRIHRPSVMCLIVGNGPERMNLEEIARRCGMEQNVHFLGFIENERRVYDLMRASRLFVLPSTREGFGISVLEANACGIPALVVEHVDNGACKLIRHGKNGFICDLDEEKIAGLILRILAVHGEVYRERCLAASASYGWAKIARSVAGLYDRSLDQVLAPRQIGSYSLDSRNPNKTKK